MQKRYKTGPDSSSAPARHLVSKYEQLYERLWRYVQSADVADGDALPSEPALAEQYNVSRVTVRKALDLLERDRLIVRKRRVGTFASKPVVPILPATSIGGLASEIEWVAGHSTLRVLAYERFRPSETILKALELAPKERVRRFARVRLNESGPMVYLETYFPQQIEELISREEVLETPPIPLLLHKGIELQRVHQIIAAECADDAVAEQLEVKTGIALMRVSRVLYNNNDEPILYSVSRMRADRYELHYTFAADADDRAPTWWQKQ